MSCQKVDVEIAFNFKVDYVRKSPIVNKSCNKHEEEEEKNQLKFSLDLQKMLHIQNYGRCTIYGRQEIDPADKYNRWKALYRLAQFPDQILVSKHNHLFSPNFTYFINFDHGQQRFKILRCDSTGKQSEFRDDTEEYDVPTSISGKILEKTGMTHFGM